MDSRAGCILVVDDEVDSRQVLRFHLEDLGYEILEAADGQEALEVFEECGGRVELVITDIRMPRMDGEVLILELHKREPNLPIVGITGHMDLHETLRMMGQGAYYYMHKPLDPWPITDRLVDNAVRFHRNERDIERRRQKEVEIARLLRTYITETPVQNIFQSVGHAHEITLEIASKPIDRNRPSGDFAEWFRRTTGEVCFYVADASGHDDLLPCFLSCLSNMVLHRCHHGCRPTLDQIVESIDQALGSLRDDGALDYSKYLTFFIGFINLEFGELTYINAGHPAGFFFRPGRAGCRRLEQTCRPVGLLLGNKPVIGRENLRPGDLLFVYTDGANEFLQGDDRAEVGLSTLETILAPMADESAQQIVDGIADYLIRKAGSDGLPDDTTLLAVKVHATP
ncbi:MAG TPA: SpoIIE family protein phosphatase [Thermoanaerobaculia bacterium]|nr:SpoIIE family protein phosphatase [Thermoanaerobaculia bacterium]